MGVGIDQARRDDHPPRIDHLACGGAAGAPDIDDAVTGQLDIADEGRAFRPRIDRAAMDHDIDARVAGRGGDAPDESGQGEALHRGLLSGRRWVVVAATASTAARLKGMGSIRPAIHGTA